MYVTKCSVFLQSPALERYTRHKAADLKECVGILHQLQMSKRGSALVAVREKYNQPKVYIFPSMLPSCLLVIVLKLEMVVLATVQMCVSIVFAFGSSRILLQRRVASSQRLVRKEQWPDTKD